MASAAEVLSGRSQRRNANDFGIHNQGEGLRTCASRPECTWCSSYVAIDVKSLSTAQPDEGHLVTMYGVSVMVSTSIHSWCLGFVMWSIEQIACIADREETVYSG